jgi:hypothetical protein
MLISNTFFFFFFFNSTQAHSSHVIRYYVVFRTFIIRTTPMYTYALFMSFTCYHRTRPSSAGIKKHPIPSSYYACMYYVVYRLPRNNNNNINYSACCIACAWTRTSYMCANERTVRLLPVKVYIISRDKRFNDSFARILRETVATQYCTVVMWYYSCIPSASIRDYINHISSPNE